MRKTRCHSLGIVGVALLLLGGQTRPGLCQRTLSDGISDLASQISTRVTQQQKRKIAVIPFRELDGRATVLGTYMSEALVTQLVNSGSLEVVERTMLDRILSEMKLGESGLIDPNTAKRVGQVAGVDAIVTGTITDLQSYVAANCRLIDAATGRIFAAAEARIVKDDDVKKIMGVSMGDRSLDGAAPSQSAVARLETSTNPSAPAGIVEAEGFRFSARGCRRRGAMVCTVSIENIGSDERQLVVYGWTYSKSYMYDDFGNQYDITEIGVGPRVGGTLSQRFIPGLAVNVDFYSRDVRPEASRMTLAIGGHDEKTGRFSKLIVLKGIPVSR